MEFTYSRSAVFDIADIILAEIGATVLMSSEKLAELLNNDKYWISAYDLLKDCKLIGRRILVPTGQAIDFFITDNGRKALSSGGIRQYILDYDQSFSIVDNFPLAVRIEKSDLLYGTYIVKSESQLKALRKSFDPSEYVHLYRLSRRPSITLSTNISNTSYENITVEIGTVLIDSQNNNKNSRVYSNSQVRTVNKATGEGGWTKTSTIVAIVALIATVMGVYFAWKALAPVHSKTTFY